MILHARSAGVNRWRADGGTRRLVGRLTAVGESAPQRTFHAPSPTPGYASEQTEPSKRINVPALETDLQTERQHLSESRKALKRMRERTEALFATTDSQATFNCSSPKSAMSLRVPPRAAI